uniref:Uncharacterized protein n=1 Tax=Ananas comosus var. bracteatus TaxID=296719 RepID=A0A6V7NSY1_ANACO|nr:unnamed protein product [Ananas comosus var. bracteatus]
MAVPVQPSTLAASQPTRGSGLAVSLGEDFLLLGEFLPLLVKLLMFDLIIDRNARVSLRSILLGCFETRGQLRSAKRGTTRRFAYGVEWDRHIPRVGMLGYHRHLGGTSWTTFGRSLIGNGNRHSVENE